MAQCLAIKADGNQCTYQAQSDSGVCGIHEEGSKAHRPSKKEPFLNEAEKILFEDINAVIYTDEELIDAVNDRLEEDQKITYRTFQNWKAEAQNRTFTDELGARFFRLIKKALREQKKELFAKFRNEKTHWQKWAWIIERKFDEWNIKQKVEHDMTDQVKEKLRKHDEMIRKQGEAAGIV